MPRKLECAKGCDYDVAIIGAGPAGLVAANSIRYEGPRVVLLDEKEPGGQVAKSPKIQNVVGAPAEGVPGGELMAREIDKAHYFGVDIRSPFRAVRITRTDDGMIMVTASNREKIKVPTVVLALGASHRRLDADGIEQFMGRGVIYTPPQYHVHEQWIGKHVGIVGGGNSAGQIAMFLADCEGCHVHMFVRGSGLEDSMSSYLIERVKTANNIKLYPHSEIKKVVGNGDWMSGINVVSEGKELEVPLNYLCIQIGAEPQTGWLLDIISLDKRGFIPTDRDLPIGAWPENAGRAALRFETSMPGVFACGDVHADVPNRMSVAIGEGAVVAVSVNKYLTLLRS